MYVDDGLLLGKRSDPIYQKIEKLISEQLDIKRWQDLDDLFAVFLLRVLRATFRSRSNQTMGCAYVDVIVLKAMCKVQVWHVDGVWLKHSS